MHQSEGIASSPSVELQPNVEDGSNNDVLLPKLLNFKRRRMQPITQSDADQRLEIYVGAGAAAPVKSSTVSTGPHVQKRFISP